jgi:hypothetical protein
MKMIAVGMTGLCVLCAGLSLVIVAVCLHEDRWGLAAWNTANLVGHTFLAYLWYGDYREATT